LCDFAINGVEVYIQQNGTETQIIDFLSTVCNLLSGNNQPICLAVLKNHGADIIQQIINNEPPAKVCQQLSLCPTFKGPFDLDCSICTILVSYVEELVATNATETEIENALDGFCQALGPIGSSCVNIVNAYTPAMIAWIEKQEDPAIFCAQVGLCTTSTTHSKSL